MSYSGRVFLVLERGNYEEIHFLNLLSSSWNGAASDVVFSVIFNCLFFSDDTGK